VAVLVLAALAGSAESGRHTVRKGETLAKIAKAHGTTVDALVAANGLRDANLVVIGTSLVIPGGQGTAGAGYTVKRGDTLASIARRTGTTVKNLAAANGLRNANLIVVGATLNIPGGGSGGGGGGGQASYTVKAGDTLASIARRTGTTAKDLAAANGLRNANLIVIGATLVIPAGGAGPAGAAPIPIATGLTGTHQVQPGDTLAGIARHYGVSLAALAQANGIVEPYRIYNGTTLQLGTPAALPTAIACPVPGAKFFNDWGFARAGGRIHEGNDLFAPLGTPVLAPVEGTVRHVVGNIGGRQFRLTTPGGDVYLGSHLSEFGAAGPVGAGTVIGYVGDSGNAAGARPHLHFEFHPGDGRAVNPYPALVAAC
jgi:LysM repeat protein